MTLPLKGVVFASCRLGTAAVFTEERAAAYDSRAGGFVLAGVGQVFMQAEAIELISTFSIGYSTSRIFNIFAA